MQFTSLVLLLISSSLSANALPVQERYATNPGTAPHRTSPSHHSVVLSARILIESYSLPEKAIPSATTTTSSLCAPSAVLAPAGLPSAAFAFAVRTTTSSSSFRAPSSGGSPASHAGSLCPASPTEPRRRRAGRRGLLLRFQLERQGQPELQHVSGGRGRESWQRRE